MPLSVALDCLPQAFIKKQENKNEKENKNSESEKPFKDYISTKSGCESNECSIISSAVSNLKRNYGGQEVAYWEKEINGMIESAKGVHKMLSDSARIEEVFRFRSEELEDRKVIKDKNDLKIFIEEIRKMDDILNAKVSEEKEAKLSRIQVEEESRNILTRLPCPKTSGGLKINFDEFMRLLNEVDKTEYDSSSSCKAIEMNGVLIGESFEGDVKGEKKENATCQQQKTNNFKFVERNIQLAKCGHGTLSLTDEEKSRVESLLADVENFNEGNIKESTEFGVSHTKNNENKKHLYGFDDESKSILSQIDEKLEIMAEGRKVEGYQTKMDWLRKNELELKNAVFEDNGKESENGGKRKGNKERNCLKKINELLNSINSISGEEIYPLTEEELKNLIQEAKETSKREQDLESGSLSLEEARHPQKLITELVSNAKLLMPKFKYRFDES